MKFEECKFGRARLLLAGLSLLATLIASMPAMAQDATSDQARSYCVKMGYLYHSSPGINDGKGVCEFPNKSWCDAQAYYHGTCGPSIAPSIYPAYVSGSNVQPTPSAETLCRRSGGYLQSVHTPYGDITICAFPDGRTCDLQSLANGTCRGVDYWTVYARSWLDAP